MESSKKCFTIINRHYPPNPGITGESAWDLAKYLIENHDAEIHIVHVNRSDDGGGQVRQPIGILHEIDTIYKGKNKFLRLFSGSLDGIMLVLKARKVAKGTIICMTSPPLLPFWASLFLKNWVLWSMDLFPEGFVSAGTVRNSNPIYKFIFNRNYKKAPRHLISLGVNQGKYLENAYKKQIPTTILPCGVLFHHENDFDQPQWKKNDGKIYFGYCGNLGQAHSSDFLIHFINNFNPLTQHLILAVYGEKVEKVLKLAENKEGITILKNVPRSQLHFIDVHLVSLLNTWTHVAVPSKGISSICAGSTIIFCGNQASDTWQFLQKAGWLVEENDKIEQQVKAFIETISIEKVVQKREKAIQIDSKLKQMVVNAYEEIACL